MYTIFSNGKCKEMKGFPGIRDEDGVGGREVSSNVIEGMNQSLKGKIK